MVTNLAQPVKLLLRHRRTHYCVKNLIASATIQHVVLECAGQVIQLNLAGNVRELYFTQQYLRDLRALIEVMSEMEYPFLKFTMSGN